jgi:ABC-2 type transport system permease protein
MSGADTSPARRRTEGRIFGVANLVLLLLIFAEVNYLSFRHFERWDWTGGSLYTLSEQSRNVLAELDRDIEIWMLLSQGESQYAEVRNLLSRYEAASSHVQVQLLDPDRDPGRWRELQQRYQLGERQALGGGAMLTVAADVALLVADGDRSWRIEREDLVQADFDMDDDDGTIRLDVESEGAITGAIIEVISGDPTKVCTTQGHGEIPLEASGGGASLDALRRQLERQNLELESVALREDVPERCHVLAVLRPELAFTDDEVARVERYLRAGGNLLLAFDPIPTPDNRRLRDTGFERMLRTMGIALEAAVVVEPDQNVYPAGGGHPIAQFFPASFGDHPITRPYRQLMEATPNGVVPLLVTEARVVRPVAEGGAVDVLLAGSARSYGESDPMSFASDDRLEADPRDIAGPAPYAVATRVEVAGRSVGEDEVGSEDEAVGGRVVVLGDATILESQLLESEQLLNGFFATSVVNWVAAREALLGIPPRTVRRRPIQMTLGDVQNLALRVVVLIPLAFVFLGLGVAWSRRS